MMSSMRLGLGMRVLLCIGFEIFVTTAQNTVKGIPDSFTSAIFNSTECAPRKTCAGNLTFPDINCNCDPLCTIFNDCCVDINSTDVDDISKFDKSFFKCRQLRDLKGEKEYYLVSHCQVDWENDNIRMLCELDTVSDDFLVQTPVTKLEGIKITFKNRMSCEFQTLNIDTALLNLISSCGEHSDDLLAESCKNAQYYMVIQYSTSSTQLYRNEFCAECHGASVTALSCKLFKSKPIVIHYYDYSVLVDLNQERIMSSSYFRNASEPQCSDREVYDYKYDICREILCPHNLKPKNGQCVQNSAGTREGSCTWSKLLPSEYEIDDSQMLTIVDTQLRLNNSQYLKNESKIFICKKEAQLCTGNCKNDDRFTYVSVEFSITIVGLLLVIISFVSLLLTLLIYGAFQTLRNTPGKIVIFLAVSLIMGQLSFLVSMFVEHIPYFVK
ncbi:hypothetical protein MAR_017894 [Mya arenaria]|uniref:SMB domain-containing protein n=1 Tax=Mya arenaria TaxID=6604 RepID=A0ABY7EGK9_MYAAR|nr:hypothetical protein MAR_017894 [Mya arenaria]